MDNDHNYQYNEFNITFVVYFDEQLIKFKKYLWSHSTSFFDVQTCNYDASTVYLHNFLFIKVAKLRLLGLLSDVAYWKDNMCQSKDNHAIEWNEHLNMNVHRYLWTQWTNKSLLVKIEYRYWLLETFLH